MPVHSRCKITVLQRTVPQDLLDDYASLDDIGACPVFDDGQEIIIEAPYTIPEGFCQSAWADICRDIQMIAMDGSSPIMKKPGTAIVGCTNWFRSVVFLIEAIE